MFMPPLWLVSAVILLALAPLRLQAETFTSDQHGYSITVPDDWEAIDDEFLQQVVQAMMTPEAQTKVHFDRAFQIAGKEPLEYPYVMVQVMSYAALGVNRQPYEAEFDQIANLIKSVDIEAETDRVASDDIRDMLGEMSIGEVTLDRARRRYLFIHDGQVEGEGNIRTYTAGYFGRNAMVQILYSAPADEWARHQDAATHITDSFRFQPGHDYDESKTRRVSRLGRYGVWGLIGAVVALIASRMSKKGA